MNVAGKIISRGGFWQYASALIFACIISRADAEPAPLPDLILYNGKIVTVDKDFSINQAIAITNGKVDRVADDGHTLAMQGPQTKLIDLHGKMVLPGLIDSHVHPGAAMTEADHPIPTMETIADVLAYIKTRAEALGEGKWVEVHQVFITRLKEQRYPTLAELDAIAPKNPVLFATGPDAAINTLAMKLSGIDHNFKVDDGSGGFAEKDPATGEPTGILRNCTRYVKVKSAEKHATPEQTYERTLQLFKDYNANGLTSVADRSSDAGLIKLYQKMRDDGELPVRMSVSWHITTLGSTEQIEKRIREVGANPLCKDDPMLRIIGIKTFLDGGMLTGSAYMLEPWGVSKIYSITDPTYRGVLFIPPQRLLPLVKAATEAGLQFTAHSVGDGAVHNLLDAYEQAEKELPPGKLQALRPCITHCNFVAPGDITRFHSLGVSADIQPIWLYHDARTLLAQFGYDRAKRFQPLHDLFEANAIVGGGTDHMQKIGARQAINIYDPFLGMATTVTRTGHWLEKPLHPESALTRQQMIRMYTSNNAWLLFREHQVGSLEPGKLADFIVVDTDLLDCPAEKIADTKVLSTYLGGKLVYSRDK